MSNVISVKGPLICKEHGKDVNFIFDYDERKYFHVWKNGGKCSHGVEIKRNTKLSSYTKMLLCIWKSIKSFYKNSSCINTDKN